ncbi:VOC family protein [Parapusillimonas sp. SGNA-6]|nr:VOC family protein [Parapusillimonas sp. SGNA-6]
MAHAISTFLMFDGKAEEAMMFYIELFNGKLTHIQRREPLESGKPSVEVATFTLGGQTFMCSDSSIKHNFTFTPSTSIFVQCDDETELASAFHQLAEGGQILMPVDNYGFSKKFAWVQDRFGVSWQLNVV